MRTIGAWATIKLNPEAEYGNHDGLQDGDDDKDYPVSKEYSYAGFGNMEGLEDKED